MLITKPDSLPEARRAIAALEEHAVQFDPSFEGRRIRWRCFGTGPALILIHGGHGNWTHWIQSISLSAFCSVWLPDLPGCGDSEDAAVPADTSYLSRAIAATYSALTSAKPVVGGFSFGGVVAGGVAAIMPVSGLALCGSTGLGVSRRKRPHYKSWRSLEDESARMAAYRHNLRELMFHEEEAIDALALASYAHACRLTRLRTKELSQSARLYDDLERISCPILAIWGANDITMNQSEVAERFANRSATTLMFIDGAGHWVQYEKANVVNRAITDWYLREVIPNQGLAVS